MELTDRERRTVDFYERANFNGFWAKIHLSDGWKIAFLAVFYMLISFPLITVCIYYKWDTSLAVVILVSSAGYLIQTYRLGFLIKKLVVRIKELEGRS